MREDLDPNVAEVLERIRTRLQRQTISALGSDITGYRAVGAQSGDTAALSRLLSALQTVHSQAGLINPRPPGLHNDSIQLVKRMFRRILAWYFRPLIAYQSLTTQFLSEATQILNCQQTQLRGLEERIGMLAADLVELRQQLQAKLDWIVRELEKSEKEQL